MKHKNHADKIPNQNQYLYITISIRTIYLQYQKIIQYQYDNNAQKIKLQFQNQYLYQY